MTDAYQKITDLVISQMETAGADWVAPFRNLGGLPRNATTKQTYRGVNILVLALLGNGETEFATYKQWQSVGAQVRKGSKGLPIVFFKMMEREKNGEIESYPMARYSTVFSAAQVDGLEAPEDAQDETEQLVDVDAYIAATAATIHTASGGAYYAPASDAIYLPPREAFVSTSTSTATEGYYATALHELTHWTGHKSRLDRHDDKSRHGYAFEELIAEIGAAIQCVRVKVSIEPRADHAQYLNTWLKCLKSDKRYVFQAATKAHAAVDYLESLQSTQEVAA